MRVSSYFLLSIILLFVISSCEKNEGDPYLPMTLHGTVYDISEFGLNDGKIDISIIGGEEPFLYFWSNSKQCEDLDSLCPGIYFVRVTDNRNEMVSDTFELVQPSPDTLKVEFTLTDPTETGVSNGSIYTKISGGYPPFTFLWLDGYATKDRENIPAGEYILSVQDSRGQICVDTIYLNDYLTDIDGNQYKIIKIGSQSWMQQNLRVTHDPNGNAISAFVYLNNSNLINTYGCLYTWHVAMNGSVNTNAQGICPDGWHIPSDNDFKTLEIFLGMTEQEANLTNTWRGTNIGTALKLGGSSGYDAVLAGRRSPSGLYSLAERMEYMWTSNESGNNAWRRCLDKYANNVGRWNTFSKEYGFSVRCVKND